MKIEDRDLLVKAALAAGEEVIGWTVDEGGAEVAKLRSEFPGTYKCWQPLHDNRETDSDGDALRLAVKLNLHVIIEAESSGSIGINWGYERGGLSHESIEQDAPEGGDDYAATRRAIVRAAAAMFPDDAPD